jgi:sec-independent protein translocase protein TatB
MFDFGWQEFLVIAFVLVLVVGPKDLPRVLKTVTQYLRNMRQMASEFHRGIEKMADEADLKDVKQSFNDINNKNFDKTLQNQLDPDNEVTKALQQAKDSADLANETKNVEETLKTVANESLDNKNISNNSKEENKTASNNDEDNLSSAKL